MNVRRFLGLCLLIGSFQMLFACGGNRDPDRALNDDEIEQLEDAAEMLDSRSNVSDADKSVPAKVPPPFEAQ